MSVVRPEYLTAAIAIRAEINLEVSCTLDAIEDFQGHLAQLERLLQEKQYEAASAAGYNDISASFVYLQRCLGGIEELNVDERLLVRELAEERQCTEAEAQYFLDTEISGAV